MRMLRRLRHGQNRRKADVGAFHDLAPFLSAPGLEDLNQLLLQLWPRLAIQLGIEAVIGQPSMLTQQGIELRFDRSNRNEITAGTFINAVEMRAAVEEITLA